MNLLSFFRKPTPAHTEPRYYAATKAENEAARTRAIHRRLELAVAVAQLTDDQKSRAIQQAKRGRG